MSDGSSAAAYQGNEPESKPAPANDDDAILQEMTERYTYALSAEQENRDTAALSIGFVWGEQWPGDLRAARESEGRPVLTNNQLGQFRNQVVNDVRQNKPAIKVHPASDDASKEIAEVYNGLIRHIERRSNADRAYIRGIENAVDGGQGYWRIITKYLSPDSFDQELAVQQIEDPMCVVYDPDTMEPDYSDAKFCFVAEKLPKTEFKRQWPKANIVNWEGKDVPTGWYTDDEIVVCDYFRVTLQRKTLVRLLDGTMGYKEDVKLPPGAPAEMKLDDILLRGDDGKVVSRETDVPKVEWFKCSGKEVLERYQWAGKYIPVVKIAGIERFVDGKRLTKGLIYDGLDAQRMYNYNITAATEQVISSKMPPWMMQEGIDEGYETEWTDPTGMNAVAHYKGTGLDGQPARPPERGQPAGIPAGLMELANNCKADMRATMGIYDPSLGQRSNETSGRAIMARERQGDNATYHFPDNLNLGICYTGRILVDLIPHIIDAQRMVRIIGDDEKESTVMVNQSQQVPSPHDPLQVVTRIINDLSIGDYDVTVETGPSYGTKRIEAANSMQAFMQVFPAAAPILGDLYASAQDWPQAEKIADRLKLLLPPQILSAEQGQTPIPPQVQGQLQQMQQGIQQLQQALQQTQVEAQKVQQENAQLKVKVANQQMQYAAKMHDTQVGAQMEMVKANSEQMHASNDAQKIVLDFIAKIAPLLFANPQAMLADVDAAAPNIASLMRPQSPMNGAASGLRENG